MSTQFGELLKDLRIAKGMTLRQCSVALGVDPSNWSKIERGINSAPKDENTLNAWIEYFGVEPGRIAEFFDKAALSRNEIPKDIASDEKVLAALPVFFRAAREAEMDDTKFAQFIDQIRKLHTPNE